MPHYLQCFERNPWFVDPPLELSLEHQGGLKTSPKRRGKTFDGVPDANCLRI